MSVVENPPPSPSVHASYVDRIKSLYEHLAPEDVERLGVYYTEDAHFRDPFNAVDDLESIRRIFRHMFANLEAVRFTFVDQVAAGDSAFVTWDMSFRVRKWRSGGEMRIHGASHLRFAADGRVRYHRDYWDTGEELYAKLPVIGGLIRWLRRRLA